ncbi:hypothetical protein ElyMa_006348100 [Elysia marginata]|uniref:Uncharacterized protein n=1 Tax=Elysia marginata TaxID=1093978 RepID=A0AAV4HNR5_9GAST|nr:hypothetical protein ElyMa_006348100 [Elysia marginata]
MICLMPIYPEPPSKEEVAKATKALKSNKAAGPDLIPPEALKADIPTTVDILYGLFVNIWEQEKDGISLESLPKTGMCGIYLCVAYTLPRMKGIDDDVLPGELRGEEEEE